MQARNGFCCQYYLAGTVPPYYREVFDVLSQSNNSKVSKEVWYKCFKTSRLPLSILTQVSPVASLWPVINSGFCTVKCLLHIQVGLFLLATIIVSTKCDCICVRFGMCVTLSRVVVWVVIAFIRPWHSVPWDSKAKEWMKNSYWSMETLVSSHSLMLVDYLTSRYSCRGFSLFVL